MKIFLSIYDYFAKHKFVYWCIMSFCFLLCAIVTVGLDYKEDIADFLPLNPQQKQSMEYYQQINRAEQIIIIFEGGDTDEKLNAIDHFANLAVEQKPIIADNLVTQIDIQQYMDILQQVYNHIPYFLTETDYERIDSILLQPDAIERAIENCKRIMQMPVSGFMRNSLSIDPLSLFSPVIAELRDFQPASADFMSLDGYMLTEDERMAFAFCRSPYGTSETGQNTLLVHQLENLCKQVQSDYPHLNVRLLGAPVVAVENASRIKKDSILSVGLAVLFIFAILLYCFRRNLRAIPLILLTITFGWLFGMMVMRMIFGAMSIIVLGIGSIIIGIAVNYPLHILFHQRYTSSIRQTLQEVIVPLLIGNITTVGAFLALVPIEAVALRDLGLFAASMLIGTILFSIVFLPPLMKPTNHVQDNETERDTAISRYSQKPSLRYAAIGCILLLTVVFWYVGRNLSFDADITHINYMTEQQRQDFAYFISLASETDLADIYVVETQETTTPPSVFQYDSTVRAVHSAYRWLPDVKKQEQRLQRWETFWENHRETLLENLQIQATKQGFSPTAFNPFLNLIKAEYKPQSFDFFLPIAENILAGYWVRDNAKVLLVSRLSVDKTNISTTEEYIRTLTAIDSNVFDISSLNSTLAKQLSDNFDYIGLVCSILVFIFLWISFRSFSIALVAFLPMAVSWIWIMGIMNLLGLQFNIVNVVLATFIFGQGDDYTIFVVEGLQYEHKTGKRLLVQFRRSIILSAVIMFAGIGVLITAQHPAMFSLGAVTLIGMIVVVLLANIIPPLLKRFIFLQQK